MPRIDSLRVFSEVVNTRNFTSAAKRLGLSPSAVSKQIGLLEDRLGVRLLNRTTRSVNPTEAGVLFFERCRHILDELDEAEKLVADMDSTPRGTLKIAAEPVFGRAMLARILADYTRAYPGVHAELFLTDHSLELVKQGFDAGIHLGPLNDPALTAITFANHNVILCSSPDYLEKHGQPNS
ncbi:MAG: LysR family transcriptional regulator, partial [Pseudomonadales bacterium]|nr:LysR family transcriptional regulator [Pseudomonadales bacterium]